MLLSPKSHLSWVHIPCPESSATRFSVRLIGWFPMAAMAKCHKLATKQQLRLVSQFWHLEVFTEGGARPMPSLTAQGDHPCSLVSSAGCSWAGGHTLLSLLSAHMASFPVCLCIRSLSLVRAAVMPCLHAPGPSMIG